MSTDIDRESETHFRQIADSLREFIWLSDVDFTTHFYINPGYERIWGRSRESLYENPASLLDGVHDEDKGRVRAALHGMKQGNYDIEFRVVRPDGEIRWVWSRGVPVRNARGEISRIAGITEDITDRKRAELALERVTQSRTSLIRGFTHDIKNPLGAADGYLSLLSDGIYGDLGKEQNDIVLKARRSITSALDLIKHLLELARAEAGQLETQTIPVDVLEVVTTIGDAFRTQASAKGLSLSMELPAESPRVHSDPDRIRQVLSNLVSNAVKYTPSGGRIIIRAYTDTVARSPEEPGQTVIEVIDNGPGIPVESQERLFQEFTRFDPNAAEGAGIGLAISQRIAHALGGTISVDSEVGRGSSFKLRLPHHHTNPGLGATQPSTV
ncbi:MAG TPA: PAS domain-containing sensor histidine kinase [Gemmatimonadaceae bacterium]